MKKLRFKKLLIAVSILYLLGAVLVVSRAFAEDSGNTKHGCWQHYSSGGSQGLWYCPTGLGGSCTHKTNAKTWNTDTVCYSAEPDPS